MSDEDQARLQELMTHRGTVVLTGEDVLRAVDLADQGFIVLGVEADFPRQGVRILVVHPDLPVTEDGCEPMAVPGTWGQDLRVIDGVVWRRSRLTVGQVEARATYDIVNGLGEVLRSGIPQAP